MKNIKKKILFVAGILAYIAPAFASKIEINPIFADPRFTPSDKIHAGCINSTNIKFKSEGKQTDNIHLVMTYNPDEIQIVGIDSDSTNKSSINYNIENDKIILNYLNSEEKELNNDNIFNIKFKSLSSLTSTNLSITTGSYSLNKNGNKTELRYNINIPFAKAQECNPDNLAPMISLKFPENTTSPIALDSYFSFDINDIGKGINPNSIQIDFAGKKYDKTSPNIKINGNLLTFYPENRLPINSRVGIQVQVSDLQSYGGANTSKKQFKFNTATGMLLLNNIAPSTYRKIINQKDKIVGSSTECNILGNIFSVGNTKDQKIINGLIQKLGCEIELSYTPKTDSSFVSADNPFNKKEGKVSVLTVVGRLLFSIALLLKIHYYIVYRKHKKLVEIHVNTINQLNNQNR